MSYTKGELVKKVCLALKDYGGHSQGLSLEICREIEESIPELNAWPDLLEVCKNSTAPNYITDWQHFAEDMAVKPNLAVYRQKFIALSVFLKRTAKSAEQIMQAITKAEKEEK